MINLSFWCWTLAFWIAMVTGSADTDPDDQSYGVIVDAGSSGSRIRLFRWTPRQSADRLPDYEEFFSLKREPGISAFRNENVSGLKPYLTELIEAAKRRIPQNKHQSSSVYLLATAGMRLLMEPKANVIMDEIRTLLSKKHFSPFHFHPLQARILSGEEEGVFAWIAANYLNHYFDEPALHQSAGILELGGASTQIAFIPDGSILADKFPVRLANRVYPLYVHSYLYYGEDFADLWVKEYLYRQDRQQTEFVNPCMLRGDSSVNTIRNINITFRGSGDPANCTTIVKKLVFKMEPYRCYPKPCAIGQTYQPTIAKTKKFFALSAFIYPLKTLNVLDEDGFFTPAETYEAAVEFCQKDLQTIMNETGRTPDYLSVECLMGLYIPILFTKGYGFANDSRQVAAKSYINGKPAEWPIGAIIYETERQSVMWCPRTEMVTSGTDRLKTGQAFVHICLILMSIVLGHLCKIHQ